MSLDQTLRELKEAYDGLVISNLALKKMVKKSEGLQGKLDVAIETRLDYKTKYVYALEYKFNAEGNERYCIGCSYRYSQ